MDSSVDPKQVRLDALAAHLKAHQFITEPVLGGVVVGVQGGGQTVVTCRPYEGDGRRLWYFTEPDRHPLAEADRVTDAVVALKGRLAVPAERDAW